MLLLQITNYHNAYICHMAKVKKEVKKELDKGLKQRKIAKAAVKPVTGFKTILKVIEQ